MKLLIIYGYGAGDDVRYPLTEDHFEKIRQVIPDIEITSCFVEKLQPEMICDADVIYGRPDSKMLPKAKSLKWLHLTSAGADDFSNKALYCNPHIVVTRSYNMAPIPIAEHCVMMFLALAHQLGSYIRQQTKGEWRARGMNRELTGSTVAIAGFGAIGHQLAKLLTSFDCRVLGIRRRETETEEPYVETVFPTQRMDEALAQADFVANLLPASTATEQIFNAERFAAMKPGSYFCNAGRGSTVDHDALADAIRSGHIAGAAIDVSPAGHAPLDAASPLWTMEEVIITPHVAGSSVHAKNRAFQTFLGYLEKFSHGIPFESGINFTDGY